MKMLGTIIIDFGSNPLTGADRAAADALDAVVFPTLRFVGTHTALDLHCGWTSGGRYVIAASDAELDEALDRRRVHHGNQTA